VGCHFLLQRIFQAQGLNPYLLYVLYLLVGRFFTTAPPGNSISSFLQIHSTQHNNKEKREGTRVNGERHQIMMYAYSYERREGRKGDWAGKVSDHSSPLKTVSVPKQRLTKGILPCTVMA